jgi:hypothetical protein
MSLKIYTYVIDSYCSVDNVMHITYIHSFVYMYLLFYFFNYPILAVVMGLRLKVTMPMTMYAFLRSWQ